ncbi:hypothetical protein SAY86_030393 [Trapa natans]|uniref:Uncharacterized protein n=1 Tax=Trapa natans TaxID=22666 RepID=A0AAN7MG03_TRANT|nr:hypothetical protein SAY86_030393 [Trapa natans]
MSASTVSITAGSKGSARDDRVTSGLLQLVGRFSDQSPSTNTVELFPVFQGRISEVDVVVDKKTERGAARVTS